MALPHWEKSDAEIYYRSSKQCVGLISNLSSEHQLVVSNRCPHKFLIGRTIFRHSKYMVSGGAITASPYALLRWHAKACAQCHTVLLRPTAFAPYKPFRCIVPTIQQIRGL